MQKKLLKMSITFIITAILLISFGYINLFQIKKNNNNLYLPDPITESQPKFHVTYDEFEIHQEIDRYNRIINLYKKIEKETDIIPIKSDIKADIKLDQTNNNFKWYSVYAVHYKSVYLINPVQSNVKKITFTYKLPAKKTVFDDFKITVNNNELKDYTIKNDTGEIINDIQFREGDINKIEISYTARGLEYWKYTFRENIKKIIDFDLEITTDFKKIIFPNDCIPTNQKSKLDNNLKLRWNYKDLLLGYNLGVIIPKKINTVQFYKLSFIAVLGLFLFFIFLFFTLKTNNKELQKIDCFFIASSFIISYIILLISVQYISIYLSLFIASMFSFSISGLYMYYKNGIKFTILNILLPQFFYLILIIMSLVFEKYTDITITIFLIITIFTSMILNFKSIKNY